MSPSCHFSPRIGLALLLVASMLLALTSWITLLRHPSSRQASTARVPAASSTASSVQTDAKTSAVTEVSPGTASLSSKSNQDMQVRASEIYSKLPLSFEANQGQADERAKFLSRGSGYSLFLTSHDAVLSLRRPESSRPEDGLKTRASSLATRSSSPEDVATLRIKLVGANPAAQVEGQDELAGKANYFIGNDPVKWRTNIPTYSRVKYDEVYPGVDLVYHGDHQQLEYDFVVAPGADPRAIRLAFAGLDKVAVNSNGDLVAHTALGSVRQRKPFIYQESAGIRREIKGDYVVKNRHEVSFEIGAYDTSKPLVIDPVLTYSTFLGGRSGDEADAIAVDGAGNMYIAGSTSSDDFPLSASAYQKVLDAGHAFPDLFVIKLDPTGQGFFYSTYIGGFGIDSATAIAVDSAGNAIVGGYVGPSNGDLNFPTTTGARSIKVGGADGVVVKLNATGSGLIFSTYFGGTVDSNGGSLFDNYVYGIAVDAADNFYVTGTTGAANFPTTVGAFQRTFGGTNDAYVTKFTPDGSGVFYSTYLGGSGNDVGRGIAVNSGNAFVTGYTRSTNFPTRNPRFPSLGSVGLDDGFVLKLNTAGSDLVYSTYLGASGNDQGYGIAVDSAVNAYVTGLTRSPDFPVLNAAQPNYGGDNGGTFPADAFITKFNPAGSALLYSSYLGGFNADSASAIAVNNSGKASITGSTFSNFPTKNAIQPNPAGSYEAFVARFDTTLSGANSLIYSTYLGGSDYDNGYGIAVDAGNNTYVAGVTESTNFPLANPGLPSYRGGFSDGFISKITDDTQAGPGALAFSAAAYTVNEDTTEAIITVNRTSGSTGAINVDFATNSSTGFTLCSMLGGTPSQNCDFSYASGTLAFANGDTSKTFSVLISKDAYTEGNETINLALSNPTGGSTVGAQSTATLTIIDNASVPNNSQPIDNAQTFVGQTYHDFLARQADQAGQDYWTGQITQCGANQTCINSKRTDVSNAFFFELEYQQTGSYVYRLYRAAYGNNQPFPNPDNSNQTEALKVPAYAVFLPDRARVIGGSSLAQSQLDFANAFVQRAAFTTKYPASLTGSQFIAAVLQTIQTADGADLSGQTANLTTLFNAGGRGAVMYRLADDNAQSNPVNNRAFIDAEYNRAFVATQYFGYLRRDADIGGFLFWLGQVNSGPLRDGTKQHGMVCSFITSAEYQQRFSLLVTHSNAECGP